MGEVGPTRDACADARAMLVGWGRPPERIELLGQPGAGRKALRRAYRVALRDGTLLKLRSLESAEAASRLAELRARIDAPFLPSMEARGAWLIEPWVPGAALTRAVAAARATELGVLLGALHAATPPDLVGRTDSRARRQRALEDIQRLTERRALSVRRAATLRDLLADSAPHASPTGLTHKDYCPENVVLDAHGALHMVDNEWLDIDAPGSDLGRSWSRWPMDGPTWERFLAGYASSAPHTPAALEFWQLVMALRGAVLRLEAPADALAEPLGRLTELGDAATRP